MANTRHCGSVTVFISGMADIQGTDGVDENGAKTEWNVHVVADKRITSRTFFPPIEGTPSSEELPDYVRQAAVRGLLEQLARDVRKQMSEQGAPVQDAGSTIKMPDGSTGHVGGTGGASA